MLSPFLHGNPVPPDRFVGRTRELTRILGRLAHHGQSTAVIGEPRGGKTSLLDYLASPFARDALRSGDCDHILVSYIDSHTLDHGLQDADFWDCALEPLSAEDSPAAAREALRVWREGGSQTRKIKALLASLGAARIRLLLLIDELDYLVQHCVREENRRTFFGSLRSITMLSRGALVLVLASRRSLAFLEELAQGTGYTGSPYFNFVTEETLGPLSPTELDTLLARAEGCFSPDDEQLVRELSGGHPYLVQLVADALYRVHADGEPDPVARRAEATERALREASRVLADMWRNWSPSQRLLLASAAAGKAVPFHAVRFPGELDALLALGFLVKESDGYRVGSELFRRWARSELSAKLRLEDPLRAYFGPDDRAVPLQTVEKQAWLRAVRVAIDGLDLVDMHPTASRRSRRRIRLFFSYAHEDDRHRERLEQHLAALRREDLIETWHDQRIAPGEDWKGRIGGALQEAELILLLISADFLASDFCVDVEMAHALERHAAGTARVIPIAVRSADWGALPFASLGRVLPRNRVPVSLWTDPDQAWTEVAEDIRWLVLEMLG